MLESSIFYRINYRSFLARQLTGYGNGLMDEILCKTPVAETLDIWTH